MSGVWGLVFCVWYLVALTPDLETATAELPLHTGLPRLCAKSVLDPASSRSGQSGHMFLGVDEQLWGMEWGRAAHLEAESALKKGNL